MPDFENRYIPTEELYTEYTRSVRPRWQIYVTILGFVLSCTVSVLGAQYRNLLVIAAGMAGILASGFLMALPTTQARNFMVQVNMHGAGGRARPCCKPATICC